MITHRMTLIHEPYPPERLLWIKDLRDAGSKWAEYHDEIMKFFSTATRRVSRIIEEEGRPEILAYGLVDMKVDETFNERLPRMTGKIENILGAEYKLGKENTANLLGEGIVRVKLSDEDMRALAWIRNYNLNLIRNVTDDMKASIRSRVSTAITQGRHVREIARDIRKLPLEPIPAGRRIISVAERAEMIARTETFRAHNLGVISECIEEGVEMVDVVGVYDTRTCANCQDAMMGSPYTINDLIASGYMPPLHPNCRCTIVPAGVNVSFSKEEEELDLLGLVGEHLGIRSLGLLGYGFKFEEFDSETITYSGDKLFGFPESLRVEMSRELPSRAYELDPIISDLKLIPKRLLKADIIIDEIDVKSRIIISPTKRFQVRFIFNPVKGGSLLSSYAKLIDLYLASQNTRKKTFYSLENEEELSRYFEEKDPLLGYHFQFTQALESYLRGSSEYSEVFDELIKAYDKMEVIPIQRDVKIPLHNLIGEADFENLGIRPLWDFIPSVFSESKLIFYDDNMRPVESSEEATIAVLKKDKYEVGFGPVKEAVAWLRSGDTRIYYDSNENMKIIEIL